MSSVEIPAARMGRFGAPLALSSAQEGRAFLELTGLTLLCPHQHHKEPESSTQDLRPIGTVCAGQSPCTPKDRNAWKSASSLRFYLTTSTAFKQNGKGQEVPPDLAAAYRVAPIARLVWVIELVDRNRRGCGEPDVIGELILDATPHRVRTCPGPCGRQLHARGSVHVLLQRRPRRHQQVLLEPGQP